MMVLKAQHRIILQTSSKTNLQSYFQLPYTHFLKDVKSSCGFIFSCVHDISSRKLAIKIQPQRGCCLNRPFSLKKGKVFSLTIFPASTYLDLYKTKEVKRTDSFKKCIILCLDPILIAFLFVALLSICESASWEISLSNDDGLIFELSIFFSRVQ